MIGKSGLQERIRDFAALFSVAGFKGRAVALEALAEFLLKREK